MDLGEHGPPCPTARQIRKKPDFAVLRHPIFPISANAMEPAPLFSLWERVGVRGPWQRGQSAGAPRVRTIMSMGLLLPLLLLAAGASAPSEGRSPPAAEVFHCTFDPTWDANYDGWPAGWTRRSGPAFPQYVHVMLHQEPPPDGRNCLRVELDGGAAAAFSPTLKISPLLGYVVEAVVKAEQLQHDRA